MGKTRQQAAAAGAQQRVNKRPEVIIEQEPTASSERGSRRPALELLGPELPEQELSAADLAHIDRYGAAAFYRRQFGREESEQRALQALRSEAQKAVFALLAIHRQQHGSESWLPGGDIAADPSCQQFSAGQISDALSRLQALKLVESAERCYRLISYQQSGLPELDSTAFQKQFSLSRQAIKKLIRAYGYQRVLYFYGAITSAWQQARAAVADDGPEQLALIDRLYYASWPGNQDQGLRGTVSIDKLLLGQRISAQQSGKIHRQLAQLAEKKIITINQRDWNFSLLASGSVTPDLANNPELRQQEALALSFFSPELCWQQGASYQLAAEHARQRCQNDLQRDIIELLIEKRRGDIFALHLGHSWLPKKDLREHLAEKGYQPAEIDSALQYLTTTAGAVKDRQQSQAYELFEHDFRGQLLIQDISLEAYPDEKLAALAHYGPAGYSRRYGAVYQTLARANYYFRRADQQVEDKANDPLTLLGHQALLAAPEPLTLATLSQRCQRPAPELQSDLQPLVDQQLLTASPEQSAGEGPSYLLNVQ